MNEKLKKIYNPKQILALKSDARILVLHGAKRAGKTYILILCFLLLVKKHRDKKVKFIIGGASLATIQSNVLDDMGAILGHDIKLNKHNNFELFGNTVLVRPGMTSDAWKTVRGFTAYGALLNEGTALHDKYIKEVISRCSGEGSRIMIDTNPENPSHTVKTDYVDKSGQILDNGKLNIEAIHFSLDDNIFLDKEYIESIKLATPSGMFYDRDILGLWVNAQGVIYKDFNERVNVVDEIPQGENIIEYIGGVDWGFEHFGSIVVTAYTDKGNYYVLEEITKQHRYVEEYWIPKLIELSEKYKGIIFFCDSARPEYYNLCIDNNLEVFNANKTVVAGIETVSSLFKLNKLRLIRSGLDRMLFEISNYVWADKVGKEEPTKINDDSLDALRYAIYTHQVKFV